MPRSVNSPISESTRNGMSSLTTSITEIDLSRSPAEAGGETKRIFGSSGLRTARKAQASRARLASSSRCRRAGLPAPCARTEHLRKSPECRREACWSCREERGAARSSSLVEAADRSVGRESFMTARSTLEISPIAKGFRLARQTRREDDRGEGIEKVERHQRETRCCTADAADGDDTKITRSI